jgi:hypothetical protein
VVFQGAFAAITCGLIVGGFAERMKFSAVLLFAVIWFTFAYIPMAHGVVLGGSGCLHGCGRRQRPVPPQAICSSTALWTSLAAQWCTSTPRWPVWLGPSWWANGLAMAVTP